jgi:hypothetical protein
MRSFAVLLVLMVLSLDKIEACNCPPIAKPDSAAYAAYDVIFVGTVKSVGPCYKGMSEVTMVVRSLHKGKLFAETPLKADCETDCQMSFAEGEEWIIYGKYESYGVPMVELCSHSRRKPTAGEVDHMNEVIGMTYTDQVNDLNRDMPALEVISEQAKDRTTHYNERPERKQILIYGLVGLAFVVLAYFGARRWLK